MADDDNNSDVRLRDAESRLQDLLAKTAKREEILGRDAFLEMPTSLQNQLAVLQKQAEPKARTLEAILAAEENLREYNAKLDDAFNLKQQIVGERGRRSRARKREALSAVIKVVVAAVVVGGAVLVYRSQETAKAEECREAEACAQEGLCSGKLSFTPFGMQCAARGDDCKKSTICTVQGMCSPHQGSCMARTVEDCERSKNCVEQGLCSPFGGTCVAGGADDCRASRACHERSACLEVGGRCVAPTLFEPQPAPSASGGVPKKPPTGPTQRKPVVGPRLRAHP